MRVTNRTQGVRLGGSCLDPLSHLTGILSLFCFLRCVSLTEPGAITLARLAGLPAPGVLLSHWTLTGTGLEGLHHYALFLQLELGSLEQALY